MFDFHMHSTVSFDGLDPAEKMAKAAAERGFIRQYPLQNQSFNPIL